MALILASNDATVSGHAYDDRTGVSYEFPNSYLGLVVPGTPFVYYRGRARTGGGHQPQVYLGAGVVGPIYATTEGLSRCDVVDYQAFDEPLYFKRADQSYYEPAKLTAGYYWVKGVREIPQESFAAIIAAASGEVASVVVPPKQTTKKTRMARSYASNAELQRQVERYSVDVALEILALEYPGQAIVEQPHNNPGFDILVGDDMHFCEVKGTRQPLPIFFLSEGERIFAETHESRYSLLVVFAIDLVSSTHQVAANRGRLAGGAQLVVAQWRGQLTPLRT